MMLKRNKSLKRSILNSKNQANSSHILDSSVEFMKMLDSQVTAIGTTHGQLVYTDMLNHRAVTPGVNDSCISRDINPLVTKKSFAEEQLEKKASQIFGVGKRV